MKKLGLIFSVVAVALLAVSSVARADSEFTGTMYDDDLVTLKSAFAIGEEPWLNLVKTNDDGLSEFHYVLTTWYWINPNDVNNPSDSTLDYRGFSIVDATGNENMWTNLDTYDWSNTGDLGNWQAISTLTSIHPTTWNPQTAQLQCSECSSTTKCIPFTRYVPEPISSSLFILGAGAFGLRIFRRKKA